MKTEAGTKRSDLLKEEKTLKSCLRRALRTFVQAAAGYASVNIVYAVSSSAQNFNALKSALTGVVISAAAAGFSAIMNLPCLTGKSEKSGGDGGEESADNSKEGK